MSRLFSSSILCASLGACLFLSWAMRGETIPTPGASPVAALRSEPAHGQAPNRDARSLENECAGHWEALTSTRRVRALAYDPRTERLWVGTYGGAVAWPMDGSEPQVYTTLDGLVNLHVLSIAVDPVRGDTWFGTLDGLSRLDAQGQWASYEMPDPYDGGASARDIAVDVLTGDLWIATGNGLVHRAALQADARFEIMLPGHHIESVELHPHTGDLWIALEGTDSSVRRLSAEGEWTIFTEPESRSAGHVFDIAIDSRNDDVWFAGSSVMRHGVDGHWTTYPEFEAEKTAVYYLAIDIDEGRDEVWIVGDGGWTRLGSNDEWQHSKWIEGFDGDIFTAVTSDPKSGQRWIGVHGLYEAGEADRPNGGIAEQGVDGRWRSLIPGGLRSAWPNDVAFDPRTDVTWLATRHGAIRILPDGRRWTYGVAEGLVAPHVRAIAVDRKRGDTWFGTEGGASRLDAQGRWAHYTGELGLLGDEVHAIAIEPDTGAVWFGTRSGASRRSADGSWQRFGMAEGLGAEWVRAIAVDEESGDVWFATSAGASRRDRNGNWASFDRDNSLLYLDVDDIAVDPVKGDVWFANGGGGTFRLDRNGEWTKHVFEDDGDPFYAHVVEVDPATGDVWFGSTSIGRLSAAGEWEQIEGVGKSRIHAIDLDLATGDLRFALDGGLFVRRCAPLDRLATAIHIPYAIR